MPSRLALLVLLLATGCSNRERGNPFDVGNPRTQGRPAGFVALAGNGSVVLTWQPVAGPDVIGYQLYRRNPGDTEFRLLSDVLPLPRTQFPDFQVTNGSDYVYRLFFVFAEGRSGQHAEAAATPGRVRAWVTDFGAATLLRLTPDARNVLATESGFQSPTQLAVDPATGVVWISDTFDNRVVIYDPNNGGRVDVRNLSRPTGLAVDPATQTGWICDPGNNRVLHVTRFGELAVPGFLAPVDDAIAIAVDPNDGSVWVCESLGNRVRRFASDGSEMWRRGVTSPSRVAIDSVTREGWITSLTTAQVVRILPTGAYRDTLRGFQGPIGIDIDPRHGRAWVADAVADQVVILNRAGTVLRRISTLPEVREVAVDRASGEAWATVPGTGSVVRLSGETGAVIRSLGGFTQPYAIAIDFGR